MNKINNNINNIRYLAAKATGIRFVIPAWDYRYPQTILGEICRNSGVRVDYNPSRDGYRFYKEPDADWADVRFYNNGSKFVTEADDVISLRNGVNDHGYVVIEVRPGGSSSEFLGYCVDLSTLAFRALGHGARQVKILFD